MEAPAGVTTIWRILTRARVITPEPRKRPKRWWIRFEGDLPNECWQADFPPVTLPDGTDTQVLLRVDDHSPADQSPCAAADTSTGTDTNDAPWYLSFTVNRRGITISPGTLMTSGSVSTLVNPSHP